MDIAEHAHDSGPPKAYRTARSWRIEANVKDLAVETGECIVKDGVGIREIYNASDAHRRNMRLKHFVLLQELGTGRLNRIAYGGRGRLQPYHNVREAFMRLGALGYFNDPGNSCSGGAPTADRGDGGQKHARTSKQPWRHSGL